MQGLSEDYFQHWANTTAPLEAAQAQASYASVPSQAALDEGNIQMQLGLLEPTANLQNETIAAQRYLLPKTTELRGAQSDAKLALMPQGQQIASQYLTAAGQGVDIEDWANRAGADVQVQWAGELGKQQRNAQRLGLDPNSGSYVRARQDAALQAALGAAGATTAGRRAAEDENWKRLSSGATYAGSLFQ